MGYKVGLVKCLIDWVYKIDSTWKGFHFDVEKVFGFLKRNLYPEDLLFKVTKTYLNNKLDKGPAIIEPSSERIIYLKLPYLGKTSLLFKDKIKNICSKYNIKSNVKLAFSSFKICTMLSPKDKHSLMSHVVYKFQCAACADCYVGFTTRHFSTRTHEHLFTDKESHVYKHLESNQACRDQCSTADFSVIDHANTEYQLRIKEAIHIQWQKPVLNIQKNFSCKMTLTI